MQRMNFIYFVDERQFREHLKIRDAVFLCTQTISMFDKRENLVISNNSNN